MSATPSKDDFDWSSATVNPTKWRKQPLKSLGTFLHNKKKRKSSGSGEGGGGDAQTEGGGDAARTELYLRQLSVDDLSAYDDEKRLLAMSSDDGDDIIVVEQDTDAKQVPHHQSQSQQSFVDTYNDSEEHLQKPASAEIAKPSSTSTTTTTRQGIGRNHSNIKQVGKAAKSFFAKRMSKWREKEAAAADAEASGEMGESGTASITTSTAHDSGGLEESHASPATPPTTAKSPVQKSPREEPTEDQPTRLKSIMDPSAPLKPPMEEASAHSATLQSLVSAPSAHSQSTTYSYNNTVGHDSNITTLASNLVMGDDDGSNDADTTAFVQFKVKTASFVAPDLPKERLPERKPSKKPLESETTRRSRTRPARKPLALREADRSRSRSRSRSVTRKADSRSKSKDRAASTEKSDLLSPLKRKESTKRPSVAEDDVVGDLPSTLKRKGSSRTISLEKTKSPPGNLKRKVSLDRSVKSMQVDMHSSRTQARMTKRSSGATTAGGHLDKHLSPRRKSSTHSKDKTSDRRREDGMMPRRSNSTRSAATTGVMQTSRDKRRSIESHQHRKRHGRSKERPITSLEAKLVTKSPAKRSKEDGEKSVGSRMSRSKSSDHVREMAAALSPKKPPLRRSSSFSSAADQSGRHGERSKAVEYTPKALKKQTYRSPLSPKSDEKEQSPKAFIKRSKHSLMKEAGGDESALQESTRIYREEIEEALNNSFGTVRSSEQPKKQSSEYRRRRDRRRSSGTKSHSPTGERQSITHRKGHRHSSARSRSQEKAVPTDQRNRRGKIHHTRSQELWLTQTPKAAPTQKVSVDLKRVPHTDGKTREKYKLTGDAKNLRAPKLDGNRPSRRGTRSGKPSKTKSTSTRGTSSRQRSSSPGKIKVSPTSSRQRSSSPGKIKASPTSSRQRSSSPGRLKTSPTARRRHHSSRSRSRDRTLPVAPNLNDLDGHIVANKPSKPEPFSTSCESTAES